MIPVYHVGKNGCGALAFNVAEHTRRIMPPLESVRKADGSLLGASEPIACPCCGRVPDPGIFLQALPKSSPLYVAPPEEKP